MFSSISLPGSQRHSTHNDYSRRTHSDAYCYGWPHSAGVIRWKPMKRHGCNDKGHLYQECPMRRRLQETVPLSTSESEAETVARRTGNTMKAREEEGGMPRHRQGLGGALCITPAGQEI